jgi:hypothetical protein
VKAPALARSLLKSFIDYKAKARICQMKPSPSPYASLLDALRLLPNIRPACERDRLGEAKYHASCSPDNTATVNGVPVTLLELQELFLQPEAGGSPRISPAGAALLLRLFEQGAFDFPERREVEGGLELLTQYSKGLATLVEAAFWRKARRPRSVESAQRFEQRRATANPVELPTARRPSLGFNVTIHRLM